MSLDLPEADVRWRSRRRRTTARARQSSDHPDVPLGGDASVEDFEFTVDRDWRITSITPRTAAWCGSTVGNLVGRDSREVWAPPTQPVAEALEAALAKGATSSVVTQPSQFAPGRWVQVVVGPSPGGARFRFEDITSQLSAEEPPTLDDAGSSYSLGAGPTEICVLDQRGVIVSANTAWRAGLVAHNVAVANGGHGMRYADVCQAVIPELDKVVFQKRLDALLCGRVSHFEATFGVSTPHGRELRQVQIAPLRDGEMTYFAAIHEDLTERARVLATLHETSDQLLHAQEQERQRIAIELHDSTSQHLAAMILSLQQLRREVGWSAAAQARIDEIGKLVQQTVRETRVLSYLMNASGREREGLESSVRRFVEGFGRRAGLDATFDAEGPVDAINAAAQHAVFRVVQEALANVHRHARASKASVELTSREGVLSVRISDNGRGLRQVADGQPPLGVGIPGMRARIAQLGGDLEIAGSPSGTVVTAIVPLRPGATSAVKARPDPARRRLGTKSMSGEGATNVRGDPRRSRSKHG
jgi:signal transduction histidine kinase